MKFKETRTFKTICLSVIFSLLLNMPFPVSSFAQGLELSPLNQFIHLSSDYSFPVLKGLRFDPRNPLRMEFIIDTADKKEIDKEEASSLIRYFLAGLTVAEEDIWVNLSPYEKDKIITKELGQTDLGKDLLSQDYLLKQLMASLTYPENSTGKDYWDKTYQEVFKIARTTNLPINTFNKIWIVPDEAEVYENGTNALITKATLKTMLEEDYLALKNNTADIKKEKKAMNDGLIQDINQASSRVMKDVVLPEINKDVNQGKNFAQLRQIYHSLILGIWFKKKFRDSLYAHYINQGKIAGIDLADKDTKDKIYNHYVEAFKTGLYNYVKTDQEPQTSKRIKRRYYSGGFSLVSSGVGTSSPLGWFKVYTKGLFASLRQYFAGFSEKLVIDLTAQTAAQNTWITGAPTKQQILLLSQATKDYLIDAGKEDRIFNPAGDSEKQVKNYAAKRTSPARQLPYLEKKGQAQLAERLKKAAEFNLSMINSIDLGYYISKIIIAMGLGAVNPEKIKRELIKETRHAIVLDEAERPFFSLDEQALGDGKFIGVTATSGGFLYDGYKETERFERGQPAQTIYRMLSEIEGYMALAESDTGAERAYIYKILHEYLELNQTSKGHRQEESEVVEFIDRYDKKILEAWKERKDKQLAEKLKIIQNRVVAEVTPANIAKFLNPELDGVIPDELIKVVKEELQKLVDNKLLVDYQVFANGGDIIVYTTRPNAKAEEDGPKVVKEIEKIYLEALNKAKSMGIFSGETDVFTKSFAEQTKALEIRRTFRPLTFTERKAEPIAVFSASNTYVGAFNLPIWRFWDPMTNAGATIDPQGDRGVIFEVWDSLKNKIYRLDSITQNKELRVLISEPGRYAIIAAYPKKEHNVAEDEPILAVSVKRIFDDGKTPVGNANPVLIVRSQSGLPAWGELIEAFSKSQPVVTYGGEKNPHMVAWRPTHIDEANQWGISKTKGLSIFTGFGYQSHLKGKIGLTEDVGGDKTLNLTRENADRWDRIWKEAPRYLDHQSEIEPIRRPHVYNRQDAVEETRNRLEARFSKNPDPKKGETDSILQDKGDITISTIKADIGSDPGHFKPHKYLLSGSEEYLRIAKEIGISAAEEFLNNVAIKIKDELYPKVEKGEMSSEDYAKRLEEEVSQFIEGRQPQEDRILDFKVWHSGDDIQLTIVHNKGVEASDIHMFAWNVFEYAGIKALVVGLYARNQDLLKKPDKTVSGNIQGAGPGYAEVPLKNGESVVNLSADKTAPGAFTAAFLGLARKAIAEGRFKDGLIAEIWDINRSKRIFSDLTDKDDYQDALNLLSAPEEYAIKRLWTTTARWDKKGAIPDVLSSRPIAAASTERLVLVAGGYVGKDDPTEIIVISPDGFREEDVINIWQYPQIALGFMRGSHTGPIMPDKAGSALPHRFDGPPPLCGWIFRFIRGDEDKPATPLGFYEDAFANVPWLADIQEKANWITDILRAQGFMPPHVVEGPDKEYTTAPKVLAALEAQEELVRPAGNEAEELFQRAASSAITPDKTGGLPIYDIKKVFEGIIAETKAEQEKYKSEEYGSAVVKIFKEALKEVERQGLTAGTKNDLRHLVGLAERKLGFGPDQQAGSYWLERYIVAQQAGSFEIGRQTPAAGSPIVDKMAVAGNWKLRPFKTEEEARAKAREFKAGLADIGTRADIVLYVPDKWMKAISEELEGSNIAVGVQSFHFDPTGTGSADVINQNIEEAVNKGAKYAMVGHSMHRAPDAKILEAIPGLVALTNERANQIVKAILADGRLKLWYVVAVDEQEGKDLSEQEDYIREQINNGVDIGLDGVSAEQLSKIKITVEPMGDISTKAGDGVIDPKTKVNFPKVEMLARHWTEAISKKFGKTAAVNTGYGATVSPDTSETLASHERIFNLLPGGMSLEVANFRPTILNALKGKGIASAQSALRDFAKKLGGEVKKVNDVEKLFFSLGDLDKFADKLDKTWGIDLSAKDNVSLKVSLYTDGLELAKLDTLLFEAMRKKDESNSSPVNKEIKSKLEQILLRIDALSLLDDFHKSSTGIQVVTMIDKAIVILSDRIKKDEEEMDRLFDSQVDRETDELTRPGMGFNMFVSGKTSRYLRVRDAAVSKESERNELRALKEQIKEQMTAGNAGLPIEEINKRIKELETDIAERQNRIKEIRTDMSTIKEQIEDLIRVPLFARGYTGLEDKRELEQQNERNREAILRIEDHIRKMSGELSELKEKAAKPKGGSSSAIESQQVELDDNKQRVSQSPFANGDNPGGIDLERLKNINTAPNSAPVNFEIPFDVNNFSGFSFQIVSLEKIEDLESVFAVSPQEEGKQLAYLKVN